MSFLQPTLFSKLVCNCDQLVSIWPFYNSWYLRWNFKGHSFSWVHSLLISKHRLFYDFRLLSCTYSRFPWTLRIAKVCHGQYARQQHQGPFLRRCRHKLMGRVNPCHTATPHIRVGLIAPSCSSKLVPVVFLFQLVYYLRKQLKKVDLEWFWAVGNF